MSEGFGFEGDVPVAPAPTASARVFAIQEIYDEFLEQYTTPKDCGVLPPDVCWTWVEAWAKFYASSQSSKLEGVGQEAAEKRCCENGYFGETHDCMKQSAQSAEVERLSKLLTAAQNRHVQFMVQGGPVVMATDFDAMKVRAEAAESKLSQLQLANEEKAEQVIKYFIQIDDPNRERFKTEIVAILNGGQQ